MKKIFVPLTALSLLALVACGEQSKPASSPSTSEPPVVTTTTAPADSSSAEPAPSSTTPAPSSSSTSQAPTYNSVTITNKDELTAAWYVGREERKIKLTIDPAANVSALLNEGLLTITSSNPQVVKANGLTLTPEAAGTATITVALGELTDTVQLTVTEWVATAESRHQDYNNACLYDNAKDATEMANLEIQGVIVQIQQYADSQNINVAIQEGKYGYWVNNVPSKVGNKVLAVGDSVSMKAGSYYGTSAKLYGGAKYVSDIQLLANPIEIDPSVVLGSSEASFADSRCAKIALGLGAVGIVTEAEAGLIKFTLGNGIYRISYAASGQTTSEAIVAKLAGLDVGCRITKLEGVWGGSFKEKDCSDMVSIADPANIEFEAATPTAVAVSGSANTVQATQTITLTAVVSPAGASQEVVWSSSDNNVATVDQNGVVTGVAEGNAVITATAKNTEIAGTFNVAVTPAPVAAVESVAVTAAGDATGAEIGGTLQLSASVLPANAAQSVTWASSDEEVATVDANGLVTFVGDGPVTITATSTADDAAGQKVNGTIALNTVVDVKTFAEIQTVASGLANKAKSSDLYYFRGTVISKRSNTNMLVGTPDGAVNSYSLVAGEGVTFAVGDAVLLHGKVEPYNSVIEIVDGNIYKTKAAVVAPSNEPIEIATAAAYKTMASDAAVGANTGKLVKILNAAYVQSGQYHNIGFIGGEAVSSTMYAEMGVSVPADGVVGTAYCYIYSDYASNQSMTMWLHSFEANPLATGDTVAVTASKNEISVGERLTLSAVVSLSSLEAPGTEGVDQTVEWSSSAPAVATVSNAGVVEGVSAGQVTITATIPGTAVSNSVTLTVTANEATAGTAAKTIAELYTDNNWTLSAGQNIGTLATSFALDSIITVSTSGQPNCGSIWENSGTKNWRLYQNKGGNVTISAGSGYVITSITFTFTVDKGGTLLDGETALTSGTAVAVNNLSSKTFTVGNSGDATNGVIRISAFSVSWAKAA